MPWRLHQTNEAIQSVDIIRGEPDLLGVWSQRERVIFYDLETGVLVADHMLDFPDPEDRRSEEWHTFITTLKAPNGGHLPLVRIPGLTIYATGDGHIHLYHTYEANLYLAADGEETKLDTGNATDFVAIGLDRALGIAAALDVHGHLHIYQQRRYVSAFKPGLVMSGDSRPMLSVADHGEAIFVSDGQQIIRLDTTGAISHTLPVPYVIRQMICAPNGWYLVTSDMDTGVIRLYDGRSLRQTHQRFAIDLLAEAVQIQLLADLPPAFVAPVALTVGDDGTVAFAMSGVICVSGVDHMTELPSQEQTS